MAVVKTPQQFEPTLRTAGWKCRLNAIAQILVWIWNLVGEIEHNFGEQ